MSDSYGFKYTEKCTTTSFTTSTDPAIDAAVSTAIIDGYVGVVITLSTTGNAQTLEDPTVTTAGKTFTVSNASTSTDSITVNTVDISAGESQIYIWDGDSWSTASGIDATHVDNIPAGNIVATNVQDAVNELDTEKVAKSGDIMTGDLGIGISPTALLQLKAGTATAGTAPLKFTTGVLLTTPEKGAIEYDGDKFYITNNAKQKAIDRTSDVAIETVTCENTTTETTLWTGKMNANSLDAGNIFKFHADGVVQNGGSTAADEVTIRVKVGGVTKLTLSPNTKTLAAGTGWHINSNSTQRTIGTTGMRASHIHLVMGSPNTTGDEVILIGIGTIDTTANMDVTLTAQWASASADNIISLYQGYMTYKN